MSGAAGERLLFTGFPGFLGSDLLARLLGDRPAATAHCLVPPRHREVASRRLARDFPEDGRARVELHAGDVTRPDLGLGVALRDRLAEEGTEVFHLAAVYDLEAGEELALRVNRDGTRHVLDVASGWRRLRRFHHMSTCYVSGRRPGTIREEEFDEGQSFHNPYERSKMEAERAVRRRMREGLPATVYRPSIVVGDSDTGYTEKYDGPYYLLRWILRQPRWALVPMPPGSGAATVNLVPRDYVTRAVVHLARTPEAEGETVHLADPDPPSPRALVRLLAEAAGRRLVPLPVPAAALRRALELVPGLQSLTGIPPVLAEYFDHRGRYDTRRARELLQGSGIRPPRLEEYVGPMVEFVRRNPEPPTGPLP